MIELKKELACQFDTVPFSVFSPEQASRGVVLMGHGLSADRYHDSMAFPTQILTEEYAFTVIAPDLPMHGVRSSHPENFMEFVNQWQRFWETTGRTQLLNEWQMLTAYAQENYPDQKIGYFGLSLGTQYGILFISQTTIISAAVLGLFGSKPMPQTKVMNVCAPRVQIPVYFIQKKQDEIHPVETTTHLYESLGSDFKVLDSTPGAHDKVTRESFVAACRFLSEHM